MLTPEQYLARIGGVSTYSKSLLRQYYIATNELSTDSNYFKNKAFVELWLRFIELRMIAPQEEGLDPHDTKAFIKFLHINHIGRCDARFYLLWALFECEHGTVDKAKDIISQGLLQKAEPYQLISEFNVNFNQSSEDQKHLESFVHQSKGIFFNSSQHKYQFCNESNEDISMNRTGGQSITEPSYQQPTIVFQKRIRSPARSSGHRSTNNSMSTAANFRNHTDNYKNSDPTVLLQINPNSLSNNHNSPANLEDTINFQAPNIKKSWVNSSQTNVPERKFRSVRKNLRPAVEKDDILLEQLRKHPPRVEVQALNTGDDRRLSRKRKRFQNRSRQSFSEPHPPLENNADSIIVNGKEYTKIEEIGRGGSSRVYKVLGRDRKIVALKLVKLQGHDQSTIRGFLNEITLLQSLQGQKYIIKLIDSEIKAKEVCIVMECGDVDLGSVLKKGLHHNDPLDMNLIRLYWQQMLLAVHAIHQQRIVHGDLKPANFLLVKGELKLIDFGIAKAIQHENTTNIVRDSQVGTVNYISPEALTENDDATEKAHDGAPKYKLGRSSDIWSLGCILYQMVSGRAPFAHHKTTLKKIFAITQESHSIPYDHIKDKHLLDVLRKSLRRDPMARVSIPELLDHQFLHPERQPLNQIYLKVEDLPRLQTYFTSNCRRKEDQEERLALIKEGCKKFGGDITMFLNQMMN